MSIGAILRKKDGDLRKSSAFSLHIKVIML